MPSEMHSFHKNVRWPKTVRSAILLSFFFVCSLSMIGIGALIVAVVSNSSFYAPLLISIVNLLFIYRVFIYNSLLRSTSCTFTIEQGNIVIVHYRGIKCSVISSESSKYFNSIKIVHSHYGTFLYLDVNRLVW